MCRSLTTVLLAIILASSFAVPSAEAGPLLDWWRNRGGLFRRSEPVVTAYSPQMAGCQSCVQTCQRVTVNYVPETQYRSVWVQNPVTSYRPQTSSDPCTGCQVTCMRPCTTYQWSLKRVPYTTYRPVYQTQTVQMPVASAAPSACSSCSVQGMAASTYPATSYPAATTYPGAAGGYPVSSVPGSNPYAGGSTTAPYGAGGTAADTQPSLAPSYGVESSRITLPPDYGTYGGIGSTTDQSILSPHASNYGDTSAGGAATGGSETQGGSSDEGRSSEPDDRSPRRIESQPDESYNRHSPLLDPAPHRRQVQPATAPPLIPLNPRTAGVQLRQRWDYSPIRLASYESDLREPNRLSEFANSQAVHHSPVEEAHPEPTRYAEPAPQRTQNQGWRSMRN